jgi:uncharacterized protein YgiM (DUF1202 family)
MKFTFYPVLICLIALLAFEDARSASAWVSDEFEITLRSGPSTTNAIQLMVSSGTELEVLERDADAGYTRVQTQGGTEGWVLTRYLMNEPSAREQLQTLSGQLSSATRNAPLRGHKLTPYEGGIRVPLIVDWPGVTPRESVCGGRVIIEDIFPTILEMAGVNEYPQIGGKIDGVSFVGLLKQKKAANQNRSFYWHFPHYYDNQPYSTILQGDWKLIYFHADGRYELYNIKDDIGEKNNLASSKPDVAAGLAKQLREFMIESGAQMPTYKKTGETVPLPKL